MAGGIASNKKIPTINTVIQANGADSWVSIAVPMKTALDVIAGRSGGAFDRAVTLQDLITLGLVSATDVQTKLAGT